MSRIVKLDIYDLVKIVYDTKLNLFCVCKFKDITCMFMIWSGKDLEIAKEVRKAYCKGYSDCEYLV